ncbi:hypothetical protein [Planctomyces sp. SH-PL62]|uniref:hypothetical protein n=1 Tax=Planctomyces sp. SH-PL62 TaxID=1636152 RepID=UPI00078B88DC|nr:hypothetical protein [Planctomyces sp. SH-PL62]AMV37092.1 hypothetical protein VT85_06650 [Planctomyces sp. SH-PL62]
MSPFQPRIAIGTGGAPVLSASGLPVDEALRRLEAGEPPAEMFAVSPLDLVAALAFAGLGDEESPGLMLVQGAPERPGLLASASEAALAGLLPLAPRPQRLALSAGLLQALDAWDASHEAAQEADDLGERRFSAYWHGIAHRREPDAGNASYWFRRVGRHPLFPELAQAARPLLEAHGDSGLTKRLVGSGGWDPYAMIDLCTNARRDSGLERLARRLQRLEMTRLLAATTEAVVGPGSGD